MDLIQEREALKTAKLKSKIEDKGFLSLQLLWVTKCTVAISKKIFYRDLYQDGNIFTVSRLCVEYLDLEKLDHERSNSA